MFVYLMSFHSPTETDLLPSRKSLIYRSEGYCCLISHLLSLQEPRLYRQDDGSLGPTRPPRNPYTVASRRAWTDIVRFARLKVAQAEKARRVGWRPS